MTIRETVAFESDRFVIHRVQNVKAIVEYAKARHNEGHHGPSRDFRFMATIPTVIIDHYIAMTRISPQEFDGNPEHIRRIVNDPAFADFRVCPGKM